MAVSLTETRIAGMSGATSAIGISTDAALAALDILSIDHPEQTALSPITHVARAIGSMGSPSYSHENLTLSDPLQHQSSTHISAQNRSSERSI